MSSTSNHPPLASLAQITWGRHRPSASASPHIRLRCALLDIPTSSSFPWSVLASGPYFNSTTPQWKLCWVARCQEPDPLNTQSILPTLLSRYGLNATLGIKKIVFSIVTYTKESHIRGSLRQLYVIDAEADARDGNNQRIIATTETGEVRHLVTSILLEMLKAA